MKSELVKPTHLARKAVVYIHHPSRIGPESIALLPGKHPIWDAAVARDADDGGTQDGQILSRNTG